MKAQSSTAGNKVTKGGMWGSSSFAPTAMVTMAALANQLATGCWRSTRNPWFIHISHQKKSGFTPLMLPKQMHQMRRNTFSALRTRQNFFGLMLPEMPWRAGFS
jgi:hypothetical protein